MIALDANKGQSVNLQPIYDSLNFQQSEIDELYLRPIGDAINTNITYNYNMTTSTPVPFSTLGYSSLFLSGAIPRISNNVITMHNNAINLKGMRYNTFSNNYMSGEERNGSITFESYSAVGYNTFTYCFRHLNVLDCEVFTYNKLYQFYATDQFIMNFNNVKWVYKNTFNTCRDIELNRISNFSGNSMQSINGFACNKVDTFEWNMLYYCTGFRGTLHTAQYNTFSNVSFIDIDRADGFSSNTFNNVSSLNMNHISYMRFNKITADNVKINCMTLHGLDVSASKLDLSYNVISTDINLLSNGMNVRIHNDRSASFCLRSINVGNNLDNTFILDRLPNKQIQISYIPKFEIVKNNIYDYSVSGTGTYAKVVSTDVIYDNDLNFIPTDRSETDVVLRNFNVIPYIRNLKNDFGNELEQIRSELLQYWRYNSMTNPSNLKYCNMFDNWKYITVNPAYNVRAKNNILFYVGYSVSDTTWGTFNTMKGNKYMALGPYYADTMNYHTDDMNKAEGLILATLRYTMNVSLTGRNLKTIYATHVDYNKNYIYNCPNLVKLDICLSPSFTTDTCNLGSLFHEDLTNLKTFNMYQINTKTKYIESYIYPQFTFMDNLESFNVDFSPMCYCTAGKIFPTTLTKTWRKLSFDLLNARQLDGYDFGGKFVDCTFSINSYSNNYLENCFAGCSSCYFYFYNNIQFDTQAVANAWGCNNCTFFH